MSQLGDSHVLRPWLNPSELKARLPIVQEAKKKGKGSKVMRKKTCCGGEFVGYSTKKKLYDELL